MAPAWVASPFAKLKSLTIGTTLRGAYARDVRRTSVSHSHRPQNPCASAKAPPAAVFLYLTSDAKNHIQRRSTQIGLQIPESVTDTG